MSKSRSSLHTESHSVRTGGSVKETISSYEQRSSTQVGSRQSSGSTAYITSSSSAVTNGSSYGHGTITSSIGYSLPSVNSVELVRQGERATFATFNTQLARYIEAVRSQEWAITEVKTENIVDTYKTKEEVRHSYVALIRDLNAKLAHLKKSKIDLDRMISVKENELNVKRNQNKKRIEELESGLLVRIKGGVGKQLRIRAEEKFVRIIEDLRAKFIHYCKTHIPTIDGTVKIDFSRFFHHVYEQYYEFSFQREKVDELEAEKIYLDSVLLALRKQKDYLIDIPRTIDTSVFIQHILVLIKQEFVKTFRQFDYLLDITVNFDAELNRYKALIDSERWRLEIDLSNPLDNYIVSQHVGHITTGHSDSKVMIKTGGSYVDSGYSHHSHSLANGHSDSKILIREVHRGSGYDESAHGVISFGNQQVITNGHSDSQILIKEVHEGSGYDGSAHGVISFGNQQAITKGHSDCDVVIDEVNLQGDYIRLRNNGVNEFHLGSWIIKAIADQPTGERIRKFQLQSNQVLMPGKTITIWSPKRGGVNNFPESYVMEDVVWPAANKIRVELLDQNGEERAHLEAYYELEVLTKTAHI